MSLITTPANVTNISIGRRTDKGFSLVNPHLIRLQADSYVRMFVLHSLAKECLCIPGMVRMREDL